MHEYQDQREAIRRASHILELLPAGYVWALSATEMNSYTDPVTLNVYVADELQQGKVCTMFDFTKPDDAGEMFKSFRLGPLLVSVVIEEDN